MLNNTTIQKILDEIIPSSNEVFIYQSQFTEATEDAAKKAAILLQVRFGPKNFAYIKTFVRRRQEEGKTVYELYAIGVKKKTGIRI